MNRSTALLTVLLAFAIFAIPTSAAPPTQYVMQVEVVNPPRNPVKVCDVSDEVCKKRLFVKRIKETLHSGINCFEIYNGRDLINKTLVFETFSVHAHTYDAGRITQCAIGTNHSNAEYADSAFLVALPIHPMNQISASDEKVVWAGTSHLRLVWPYTDEHNFHVYIGLEPPAFINNHPAVVEITVSGYVVDSACPNP